MYIEYKNFDELFSFTGLRCLGVWRRGPFGPPPDTPGPPKFENGSEIQKACFFKPISQNIQNGGIVNALYFLFKHLHQPEIIINKCMLLLHRPVCEAAYVFENKTVHNVGIKLNVDGSMPQKYTVDYGQALHI